MIYSDAGSRSARRQIVFLVTCLTAPKGKRQPGPGPSSAQGGLFVLFGPSLQPQHLCVFRRLLRVSSFKFIVYMKTCLKCVINQKSERLFHIFQQNDETKKFL